MMASKSFVFRFDNVEVREREFVLLKSGKPLTVEPKAFRVLLFLLHNPQKLISKEELLNSVWPDVEVTEGSLTRCIWLLRSLLGDDIRSPRYIETVATVGYRFVCPVEASEDGLGNLNAPEKSTVGNGSSRWLGKAGAIATVVVVIVGVAFICLRIFRGHTARQQARPAFSNMRITQLTSHPGIYSGPTFSPDGKQIAFFWNDSNPARGDLYVKLIGGDKALRLTHTSTGFVCCADWSPDGQEIAFARCDDSGGGVFIMPALGGSERKLTDVSCVNLGVGAGADVRWTADGKSLVLTERCAPDSPRGSLPSNHTMQRQSITPNTRVEAYGKSHLEEVRKAASQILCTSDTGATLPSQTTVSTSSIQMQKVVLRSCITTFRPGGFHWY